MLGAWGNAGSSASRDIFQQELVSEFVGKQVMKVAAGLTHAAAIVGMNHFMIFLLILVRHCTILTSSVDEGNKKGNLYTWGRFPADLGHPIKDGDNFGNSDIPIKLEACVRFAANQ